MLIECTIRTKQFKGSQDNFELKEQTGWFDTVTLVFTPDCNFKNDQGSVKKHGVQFHTRKQFDQHRIK